ncbi:MAG: hypothetical protein SFZ23_06120 [Planctomycetota bacterium]|nr:hypothetical protein [Planctomycetota bacterium]
MLATRGGTRLSQTRLGLAGLDCRAARRGSALKGCLIAAAVLLVLLIIAGVVVAMNWRNWSATALQAGTTSLVQQSKLPDDQKTKIINSVQRVTDDFKAKKVTLDQLQKVMTQIVQGPVMQLGVLQSLKERHVDGSALTPEEKEAAALALQRFSRGVIDGTIPIPEVQKLMLDLGVDPATGEIPGGGVAAIDVVKKFIENAKTKADEAKVPDEPYVVDFAAEVDKAIAEAIGQP